MKLQIFHHRHSLIGLLVIVCISSLVLEASAQSDPSFGFSNETLRVDVDLVTLSFSAKDRNKRYVDNLKKADLQLFEDEVPQQITYFDSEPMPLSLVVLLDVSESTLPFFKEMETTVGILTDLLNQQDEAAVIAFSDFPWLLEEFTHNKNKVLTALERARRNFSGATNINDSIYLAAKKLNSVKSDKRKVILLISDGKGNRGEPHRAFQELKASSATLLGVGLGLSSKLFRGAITLSQWAKECGGSLVLCSSEKDLKKDLKAAFNQIRSQYSLGYISSNQKKDGRFRRLRVEIFQNSPLTSKGIIIESPPGYFAAQDSLLAH